MSGGLFPFAGRESSTRGGIGEEPNSCLGAAGPADAGVRAGDCPPCLGDDPPCLTVSSHFSSGDPGANRAERAALASIELL